MNAPHENPAAGDGQQDTQSNTPAAQQGLPAAESQIKEPPPAQPATEHQLQTAERKIEDRMSAFERSMIRLTWAGVIVGVITLCIFGGQLYEMIEGGTQTDKIVITAQNIQSALTLANSQNLDTVNKTLAQSQTAADASNRRSKDALDATIKDFQGDQRAWVGVGQYGIQNFDNKDPFRLAIPFVNSGKSPAILAEKGVAYTIADHPMDGPPSGYSYQFEKASAVAPQGAYVLTITNSAVPPAYDAITSGTMFLYFFGVFRYHDVYDPNTIHTTSFCMVYNRMLKAMSFCPSGNDMD